MGRLLISRVGVTTLLLIGILVIAAAFRLWELNSTPPGLYQDEGEAGNLASRLIHDLDWRAFYTLGQGRDAFHPNVASIFIGAFDLAGLEREAWMIRVPGAVIGILTVWGVYLLSKEIFSTSTSADSPSLIPRLSNAELLALSAAFFVAVGFAYVQISRIAFSAVTVPFLLSFAVFFLLRAVRTWKITDFAIAGFFFGVSPYGYAAARLAPLLGLLPLSFGISARFKTFLQKPGGLLPLAAFVGVGALTVYPLLAFVRRNPEKFRERVEDVGWVFTSPEAPLTFLWENTRLTLLMFYADGKGDLGYPNNIPGEPMLLTSVGIVFLLGVFFLVKELVGHLVGRRFRKALPLGTLFIWLPIMLLPAALTENSPYMLHVSGVLPAVAIVSALGVVRPLEILRNRFHIRPGLMVALLLVFSISVGVQEYDKYFNDWGRDDREILERIFAQDIVDYAKYLREFDEGHDIYLVVIPGGGAPRINGFPIAVQGIMFLTEGRDITVLREDEVHLILPREGQVLVVAALPLVADYQMGAITERNSGSFRFLRGRFPAMIFRFEPYPVGFLPADLVDSEG